MTYADDLIIIITITGLHTAASRLCRCRCYHDLHNEISLRGVAVGQGCYLSFAEIGLLMIERIHI